MKKSNVYCSDWDETPKILLDGSSSCRCSTTSHGDLRTTRKNASQMLNSCPSMKRDSEQDNGHSLVLVLRKSGTLSKRTVHKEFGTKLQKGCCWNSLRADDQFSVLRLHFPDVNSKAKDMENCRYTLQPTRKRLRLFFAQLLLQTSSVFTEQSQRYVKSKNPFTKERGDPL